MENPEELIHDLNRSFGFGLPARLEEAQVEFQLASKFNALIREDFSRLIQFLYQVDVSEKKLRTLLQTNAGENAGLIIARLVIQRLMQKIMSRQQYRNRDNNAEADGCDEERW